MEYVRTAIVNDEEYIIQTCSANQQWDMLNMFFRYGLSDALYQIAVGNRELIAASLFGKFSELASDQERAQVTEMLLGTCIKKGETKPIEIDDFHGRMYTFILLHIEALKLNYADFMPILLTPEEEPKETTPGDNLSPL
uniref:Uncharacterized protein n=7 Tax=Vibrionaceae TaxID=641 RepID=A0A0H3ZUN1_9VIBR|nr:hypothetical protein [Vibrio splendidus]AKN36662.1 hypothetical protein [Vibrio sp. FF_482]AKN37837.1 hypothetical protein [Vibrio tasmaniensis]AKN38746.1 hypothetical protein [Enterovibrio norvegicus]AKN38954.1 hypothetical protein [Aliivibrio fischeri]AKN39135.1 hypothetical protein [Vibrio kanaloae]AKN39947.1 hypothetical protein [Vibrio sp. FF_307]